MSRLAQTILMTLLFAAHGPDGSAQAAGAQSQIAGTWRGTSECVDRNSPCHDEINVYRFSQIAARSGWFSGAASKVVNGREISMGTLEWQYDAKNHVLESRTPNGVFRLVVEGDKIEGTLLLPDGNVYRRIRLARIK